MAITHSFTSAIPDGPDPTIVRPSNWNADHVIALSASDIPPLDYIGGTGVVGQVAEFVTDTKTLQAAKLIAPAVNILTITNAAASTIALAITSAKTLTLTATDNFNLTIPATGTAALLARANVFTTQQMMDGTSDQIQLRVQGHSTQTTKLQTWETSAGVVTADIDNTGLLSFTSVANSTFISMYGNRNTGSTEVGINFRDRNAVAGGQLAARINSIRESTGAIFSLQFHTGGPVAGADATLKATLTSAGSLLIGSTTDTARLFVVGATDKLQFSVRANATQTASLASITNSAGTGFYFLVGGSGLISSFNTITDPTHAAQTNHHYVETIVALTGADAAGVDVNALKTAAFFNGGANSGGSVTGIRGTAYNQSANSLTDLYGLTFRVGVTNASATVTNAYGMDIGIFSSAAGAITNAYGTNIIAPLGTAVITNLYGLYIGAQTAGATLNYAIYTNAGLNRLGDQLSIIGSADRIQQIVKANSTQAANLQEWQTSAAAVVVSITGTGTVKTSGRRQAVTITAVSLTQTVNHEVVVFTASGTYSLLAATGTGQTVRVCARGAGVAVVIEGNGAETVKGALNQTIYDGEDLILTDTASGIYE